MNLGMPVPDHSFLVTGGAGFIGSHVAEALLHQKAKRVVALDQVAEPGNLKHLAGLANFEWIQMPLQDRRALERSLQDIDGVFHMAALPLGPSLEDPEQAVEVNVLGSLNVFLAASKARVKKIVYSSASSVYGDTLEVMDESHPLNAQTFYGITKLCAELFLRPLQSKIHYVILRYMNVYGPRQSAGLIPNVLKKIVNNESPVILGDGSASFDFVHVADVAQCNIRAMEAGVTAETFNVGSDEEFSVRQIVEMLIEYSGTHLKPTYDSNAEVPMIRRVGSTAKARKILGYQPSVKFADGLRELVAGEVSV